MINVRNVGSLLYRVMFLYCTWDYMLVLLVLLLERLFYLLLLLLGHSKNRKIVCEQKKYKYFYFVNCFIFFINNL